MSRTSNMGAAFAPTMAAGRVLIIDDSAVARAVLTRMVEGTQHFTLTAAFSDVNSGLRWLEKNDVEVILLDIAMPGTDGLTALPKLLEVAKDAKVLVVSSSADEGAAVSVQALALGAADTLAKPGVGAFGGRFAEVLEDRLNKLFDTPPDMAGHAQLPDHTPAAKDVELVVIGASTGGIHALNLFLAEIPASFQTPILITQHLPASFMSYFAAQLAGKANRPCDVATDYMRVRPGRILVAPGDAHMRIKRTGDCTRIQLTHEKASSGCMPSVDPMFESAAEAFGSKALGIVLSGMGRDGYYGAMRLAEAGARIFVQDQASSVVWGMPGTIANAGLANGVMPPQDIGKLVGDLDA